MKDSIVSKGEKSNSIKSKTEIFFKRMKMDALLPVCKFRKIEGIPSIVVLKKCIELVFTNKSWNRTVTMDKGQENSYKKDVVYRFLNSGKFYWEGLLEFLSVQAITIISRLTGKRRVKALILDDSFYNRSRSKKVELLSAVYDHTDGKFKKGFTLFTMGWSDSFSYIPLYFHLLASKDPNRNYLKENSNKETLIQQQRRENACKEKPVLLIEMVKKAKACNIPFKYVLFDSWFSFPSIVASVFREKKHVITMLKRMENIRYVYNGKKQSLMGIYGKIKHRLTKNRLRLAVKAKIRDKESNTDIAIQIIFARDEKSNKWVALLSTNTQISPDEVIRIYGIRWNIEVFFKVCKSYLKLAKEFMGRSFDMLVAHTTIVFLRYIMLSLSARENKDDKSIGDLFFTSCDEIRDISVFEAFEYLISYLVAMISKKIKKEISQVEKMVISFLDTLPVYYRSFFTVKSCETVV